VTTLVSAAVGAIVAALQTVPAVSTNIGRVRLRPWSAEQSTAVAVRPLSADRGESQIGFSGPDVWAVRIGVECYARAAPGTAPDVAVDDITQAVYTRLMADPTLSGVVRGGLEPVSLSYDFDADAEQTACAVFIFTAHMVGSITLT
jgi:hypothetical protein